MDTLIYSIVGFILLLVMIVALRVKTGNKFEIKNSDIMLALIPVAFWLFLTGKIQEFTFGDFKIVAAVREASKSPVAPQVSRLTELPVESVRTDSKGGTEIGGIPVITKNESQALSFQLGHGGYCGPAINEYFKVLTQYSFLRYIVINNSDGSFFGTADARQLAAIILGPDGRFDSQAFADWLNSSNKAKLETLPGFISSGKALNKTSDKRRAIQLMNSLDVQTLPVIDDAGRFAGIVDSSKLTASMLIDIAERLETRK